MSLLDVLRKGVKKVDTVTKPVQSKVTFSKAVISTDGTGSKTYPTSVSMRAVVDWKLTQMRTATGIVSVTRPNVIFLDVAALKAATGGAGLSDHDRITLQDGTTGPIINMSGFIDAGTGKPIATECFIG